MKRFIEDVVRVVTRVVMFLMPLVFVVSLLHWLGVMPDQEVEFAKVKAMEKK